jgi:hypothetical protein
LKGAVWRHRDARLTFKNLFWGTYLQSCHPFISKCITAALGI